ncbi:hypothetical protein FHT40_004258 [Mycolicibacterium sp. BK556]|uniref:hypothetical protein n=1 Tax=Mycobacteriaceae TaxID=1762 RepID=UPI00105F3C34|nr:hypothetical protein [Mycobacterium sp. BK086]MBB3604580.1 hypothetical protein [Mycolicibacterium sp. BK556]MBB3634707.1 hypothetical protein [Mycolicibacterium sp. BK607]MBB3752283.1 hypothetical protein [Mycolicibacterium sp. BK634]TDO17471.1 hypothetical protein EV580_0644 [Mycobacterium sp. BK086]
MSILGDWDVAIKTPIGTLHVVYSFTQHDEGVAGTAAGKDETVPLSDIVVAPTADGERVTWRQTVTKPMRLKLDFDVQVHSDQLKGHSRAGRLPRTAVTGQRRT